MSGKNSGGNGGSHKPSRQGAMGRGKLVYLALPLAAISVLTLPASGEFTCNC